MLDHLKNVADSLGLPFGKRVKTYNSRLAQELGLWAETMGKGHDFHMAAFHAYFADGKNLADHDVLMDIIKTVDLDRDKAEEVFQSRSFSTAVDEHWKLSREKGVTAVPTFIINNASLTGARPYKDLLDFVTEAAS
jgi:predicted DsbA family dithiol-disulfide isomerase